MKLVLKNDLAELATLATELEAFGERERISPEAIQQLNIALDELVTNTINYAFDEGGEHAISIDLECGENSVVATVTDDGRPFDPFAVEEPDIDLPLEERQVGGLGVFLVRKLMDEFTYARDEGRNRVWLRKKLKSSGPDETETL